MNQNNEQINKEFRLSYTSDSLEKATTYIAIIEEFDDGLCRYGFSSQNGELLLGTVGETEGVKKNPKYDEAK